ncbi:MAG: PaaI family thioesterase [Zoogloeaceae bacterium]|jgi:acyl-CoA thioesterase|nr:PaaI family thioesterase [Zoogloeaceae bacterium]
MNIDLDKIRAFFAADRFAAQCGIVIERVEADLVQCGMEITAAHLNAGGVVQGGAIFTLADLAFAVHSNLPLLCGAKVGMTVGQSNSISYLAAPRGKRLIARSTCLSRGRNISVFRVEIHDDLGNFVAEMRGNGFTKGSAEQRVYQGKC